MLIKPPIPFKTHGYSPHTSDSLFKLNFFLNLRKNPSLNFAHTKSFTHFSTNLETFHKKMVDTTLLQLINGISIGSFLFVN